MRLVHLSDIHLGFRQFQRSTAAGMNQREADVAASFTRAIDKIVALAPDVVLVGGDVFHTVRPTNTAILHAFNQFSRLVHALPDAKVIIAAGNHDMPRSTDTICILRLFAAPLGIYVADRDAKRFTFDDLGLAVLAVPDFVAESIEFEPDSAWKYNVLLMHGEVQGVLPKAERAEHPNRATMRVELAAVAKPGWDYVALGHYHVYTRVAEHAFYSGSLDYTTTNPWGELAAQRLAKLPGKGLIELDLSTGRQTFHHLPVSREFVDLTPIDGRGKSAADVDKAIQASVAKTAGGVDGKVVRLTITELPRHIARELDHKALRELQRKALHFQLDVRKPAVVRRDNSGAPGRRTSLADTLRESLNSRNLASDINREAIVALGLRYLELAEQNEPIAPMPGADS